MTAGNQAAVVGATAAGGDGGGASAAAAAGGATAAAAGAGVCNEDSLSAQGALRSPEQMWGTIQPAAAAAELLAPHPDHPASYVMPSIRQKLALFEPE